MSLHRSTDKPPAKRLFLIVGDGQRADKTFAKIEHPTTGEVDYLAPFLRSLVLNQGTYGISHTRMPTESRPGHVAMIAGFYEDVSAVTKGWKENPVDFDSVFNQSTHTYSFGSPDILPMFAQGASEADKIDTWMYGHEFEDFTQSSIELDAFVFRHLYELFKNSTTDSALNKQIRQEGNVFFLHLLGTDTSGHGYRPYSPEYYDNIKYTDEEIRKLVPKVHEFFGDEDTAFIFTSDHGMSDLGSHGDGHPDNTRCPLICWGKGCKKPQVTKESQNSDDGYMDDWYLQNVKRHDVKQADIASLMSYLIGINYPSNSVGELPIEFIEGEEIDKINALYNNALSILEQYLVKLSEVKSSQYKFKGFSKFEEKPIESYKFEIETAIKLFSGNPDSSDLEQHTIKLIEIFMKDTLEGLDYLTKYNWLLLRSIATFGFVGWIVYSFVIFLQVFILPYSNKVKDEKSLEISKTFEKINLLIFSIITIVLNYILFYQKSPVNYYLYLAFPLFFWHQILINKNYLIEGLFEFFKGVSFLKIVSILFLIIGMYEGITIGFSKREVLSYIFIGLSLYPLIITFKFPISQLLPWIISCCLMSLFPQQNPVKVENLNLVILGGVLILISGVIGFIYILRNQIYPVNKYSIILVSLQLSIILISIISTRVAVISLQKREGLPPLAQFVGWSSIVISLIVLPILHHFNPNKDYRLRFLMISLTFAPTFIILTISFESLFYLLFQLTILQWIEIETKLLHISNNDKKDSKNKKKTEKQGKRQRQKHDWIQLLRVSIIGFFFLQIAFFGVGNMASISTFSLDSVYRILPIFDPFKQGAMLMLQLMIPYAILSTGLGIMNHKLLIPPYSVSTLIISTSDILSLNFFYLVKTEGSWLDIGVTISNYCLAILSSLFMLLIEFVSNVLLSGVEVIDTREIDNEDGGYDGEADDTIEIGYSDVEEIAPGLKIEAEEYKEIVKLTNINDERPISARVRRTAAGTSSTKKT
ncbi:hypothetical protein BVG19_g2745 [[Candida] boidinii]|nr:hypothetical protein BVG19_g2745 [[Candida] boidinii]OWB49217.1 hypothetical protein B5S27_g757 [[Candida] boidinii]